MPEIVKPTRAKVGYIEGKRRRKDGVIVPARTNVVPSHGLYSTKEMEGVMREIAKEVGADESQIRIEAYQAGEAPVEANPRHRGLPTSYERVKKPTRVGPVEQPPRRVWGGFGPGTMVRYRIPDEAD